MPKIGDQSVGLWENSQELYCRGRLVRCPSTTKQHETHSSTGTIRPFLSVYWQGFRNVTMCGARAPTGASAQLGMAARLQTGKLRLLRLVVERAAATARLQTGGITTIGPRHADDTPPRASYGSNSPHCCITTKVARNFPRSFFETTRKRCNSNDVNSTFELIAWELRATLMGGGRAWPSFETTRRRHAEGRLPMMQNPHQG